MSRAVLAVSLNPALDVTYHLKELRPGETHRVEHPRLAPGGKAVNVARTLEALGHPVTLTGFLGGSDGSTLRHLLAQRHPGVVDRFVDIKGTTRRTVVVVDGAGEATGLWEAGSPIRGDEWMSLLEMVGELARAHDVTVVSGSLPPGVPDDAYRLVIERTRDAGSTVILDADGAGLWHAMEAAPDIVKATEDEIANALRVGGVTVTSLSQRLRSLVNAGARSVVATRGTKGIQALTPSGMFHARPPRVVARGNPTGAGDAVAAALARGVANRVAWPAMIDDALALAAATTAAAGAGEFSVDLYRTLVGSSSVEVKS